MVTWSAKSCQRYQPRFKLISILVKGPPFFSYANEKDALNCNNKLIEIARKHIKIKSHCRRCCADLLLIVLYSDGMFLPVFDG